jgi:hypothetical protein
VTRRRWILLGIAACALATAVVVAVLVALRRPDYRPRAAEPTLEQETRRLEIEQPLAASRKPYLILDLLSSRLVYRISGMTPKTIPFNIDSIRGPEGPLIPDQGALTLLVLEERGAPREVITPPDPDNPVEPLKDPKIFPPDPPTDFVLSFDHPLKIRILGEKDRGWRDRFTSMGKTLRRWFGKGDEKARTRIQLRFPAERAQEIYRGLYQGERILLLGVEDLEPAEPPSAGGE